MPQGLSVRRVVNVDVSFAPAATPLANFQSLLVLGDSDVVDTGEVIRSYNEIDEVSADFGTSAPEYLAAVLFFGQVPQPTQLYIGRWARTATSAVLVGGVLSGVQQLLSAWTVITNGGFHMAIDGGDLTDFTGINLSAVTNLNGVASAIQAVVRAAGGAFANVSVLWDGTNDQFRIKSGSTGANSAVSYLSAPTSGTDLSPLLKMTSATADHNTVGITAETPVASVARVDGRGWYGLMFAASTMPNDAQRLAVSAYIEAATDKHLYGISSQDSTILSSVVTSDLASQLALADYTRTFIQYSASSAYSVASWFGRALTTNFEGSNTTITMKFKKEPGVTPEILTATQADTLIAKRCNVYAMYNNGVAITQEGVMSGLAYFDEMLGLDWLSNRLQTDIFNVLYQAPKIPQTNAGIHVLTTTAEGGLSQGVSNGLIAPGTWHTNGFGQLKNGDYLAKGWYTYAQSVDDQDQTLREQRQSPLIQIAIKLAGAVHSADVLVNVNR